MMDNDLNSHIKKETYVNWAINSVVNGVIAWFIFRAQKFVLPWGDEGFVADLIITAFLLPLIVASIIISIHKGKVKKGLIKSRDWSQVEVKYHFLKMFQKSTFTTALLFGIFGLIIFTPITLLGFYLFNITEISPAIYALFKGLWAGVIAIFIVKPAILLAVSNKN